MRFRKRLVLYLIIIAAVVMTGALVFRRNDKYSLDDEIYLGNTEYDASKEIKAALENLNSGGKAVITGNQYQDNKEVILNFQGLCDEESISEIISILQGEGITGNFFVTGIEAAENPRLIEIIKDSVNILGNNTLYGEKEMENKPIEELVSDFCRANKILEVLSGVKPSIIKCNGSKYTEDLLRAAYASGNYKVYEGSNYLSYQSFKNYDEAEGYINKLSGRTMIFIKLNGILEDYEYIKAASAAVNNHDEEEISIVDIVRWITEALRNTEEKKEPDIGGNEESIDKGEVLYSDVLEANKGALAVVNDRIYTTEKAVAYTFRGISDKETVLSILDSMYKLNIKGTFFVTKNELENHLELIKEIATRGHEVGNGGVTSGSEILNKTSKEILEEIYVTHKLLESQGLKPVSYMAGYGYENKNIREALSAVKGIKGMEKYSLYTYTKAPVNSSFQGMSANEVVAKYLPVNTYLSLQRGEIVYFRMDSSYFNNKVIIPELIEDITKLYVKNGYIYRHNFSTTAYEPYEVVSIPLNYEVKPLKAFTIEYVTQGKGNAEVYQREEKAATAMFLSDYIGNRYVDLSSFTSEERGSMDITGTIDTGGRTVVFFTFDDWGGDPALNRLMEVLEKHQVYGSFFVIAKNIDIDGGLANSNPNLLRALAAKGHDIGSHGYYHETLDFSVEDVRNSLVKSYDAMYRIIGDLNSLKKYYRPPKLIVERNGLLEVFKTGYDKVIGGNISTHDYESDSPEEILEVIESGIVRGRGNIVVMHMNNQSYYTAEAIDLFLTKNEQGVYGEKYIIARLSDYLGK